MTRHSSIDRAIPRFKSIHGTVGEYRDELVALARYLLESPDPGDDPGATDLLIAATGPDPIPTLVGWLHRIASNEARRAGQRRRPGRIDAYFDCLAAGVDGPSPHRRETAAEAAVRIAVLGSLAGLPSNYRTALLLKEGLGLRVDAVADLLSTTPAATRSILYRARRALRGDSRI